MANLPAVRKSDSEIDPVEDLWKDSVAELIFQGRKPADIAKKIHPDDPKKRQALRNKLRRLVYHDADLQNRVAARARGEFIMGLGPATRALVARASRTGRQAEVKLIYEASGFHNPRVQHEHSGEIAVKVEGLPRPEPVQEEYVDAEVVED